MNRSYRILPTYTGDVSGICSALYDLGGMVVMHDPSGCNSTYNTHDETRWYQQDSLIYISGISELDAILGNDDYFVDCVVRAAGELQPKFIALACSPVPYMSGTDFPALARLVEAETGIPSFFVRSNGMHDYVYGAGNAFYEIAARFPEPAGALIPNSLNILGLTPMDYAHNDSRMSLLEILKAYNWSAISTFGTGGKLEDIRHAGSASVNLVVSATGLKAAKLLKERFGTPFVVGTPIEGVEAALFHALEEAAANGENRFPFREHPVSDQVITLIGEPVQMSALGASLAESCGKTYRVLCPLEGCNELLSASDCRTEGEEGAEAALKAAEIIVADPMYRYIAPEDAVFLELPHLAMSGRCFRKQIKNLFAPLPEDWRKRL